MERNVSSVYLFRRGADIVDHRVDPFEVLIMPSSESLGHFASVLFEAATIAIAIVCVLNWSRGNFGQTL